MACSILPVKLHIEAQPSFFSDRSRYGSLVEEEEIDEIILNKQVREMVDGTLAHAEELDGIIEKYSKTRALNRIPKLNLAILRIALYEILYDEGTPQNAAINEAVELAKNYTYQEDVSFINGLLGAYARDHAEPQKAENA